MQLTRRSMAAMTLALASAFGPLAVSSAHADAAQLTDDAQRALHKLEATTPRSRFFAHHAKAVLVFPSILKAGLVFGGETGNGVLLVDGQAAGYYNLSGGSWGLQIGGQDFAYALFFMTDSSLDYLKKSDGFAAGTGPSIVVINAGAGAEADTTTVSSDVYAFPFGEKGLMADLTLQGTKITRIHPN
jgi:lipid-binding SYLF domain-containing protein